MDSKGSSRNARVSLKVSDAQEGKRKSVSADRSKRNSTAAPSSRKASKRPSQVSRSPSTAKSRNSSAQKKVPNGRSASQQAAASTSRTPQREDSSSPSTVAMAQPSQITTNALASINYAAFNQSSLTAKQRRARMLKDFLAAHSTGAQQITEEWAQENDALWRNYLESSHAPQSREIQRLLDHTQRVESHCQQRLQHAKAVTQCALDGIEQLFMHVTHSGAGISATTGVLSGQPDEALAPGNARGPQPARDSGSERGVPLAEVQGFDPMHPDPHPPAFRFGEADQEEFVRLQGVFQRAIDSITARQESGTSASALAFSHPPVPLSASEKSGVPTASSAAPSETPLQRPASPSSPVDASTADASRLRQVEELHRELDAVGEAFVALMKRVEGQHAQYQAKIAAQRDALDAAATRTKLADDVLRDTVAQGEVEACSAVAEVQRLSLELRQRMDASEAAMQAALDSLIRESAEVCVDNDALYNYAALTSNRENCLYGYMSRMERQVVEQADVLRHAQDSVTRLWARLRDPQQTPSAAAGGSAATSADRTSALLPPLYQNLLRQSDRDTLLALVEQLVQRNGAVAAQVVRGLDEHKARAALHPVEAAEARERHLRTVATQQLLEKLDVEGHLRSNAHETTLPLSERVAHLVAQYDAYIDFNEQYARALVRHADVERREQSPSMFAFFDARTPTPALNGTHAGGTKSATIKDAARSKASGNPGKAAIVSAAQQQQQQQQREVVAPTLPYLRLWETKQRQQGEMAASPHSGQNVDSNAGSIVHYLTRGSSRRSNSAEYAPSPPRTTASSAAASVLLPNTAMRGRRHTAVGATSTSCVTDSPPPPPVPPRAGLTSYVLSVYGEENGAAAQSRQPSAPGTGTAKHALVYRDGDQQFIDRQREVFQQLD